MRNPSRNCLVVHQPHTYDHVIFYYRFTCNQQFKIEGSRVIKCYIDSSNKQKGKWSTTAPTCKGLCDQKYYKFDVYTKIKFKKISLKFHIFRLDFLNKYLSCTTTKIKFCVSNVE